MKTQAAESDALLAAIAAEIDWILYEPTVADIDVARRARMLTLGDDILAKGLPFRARSYRDAAAVKDLVRRGLVQSAGDTSARRIALTPGAVMALANCWTDPSAVARFARELPRRASHMTHYGIPVAFRSEYLTGAVGSRRWRDSMQRHWEIVLPALLMGWATRYAANCGTEVGYAPTPEGADATIPAELPDLTVDLTAWGRAWDAATAKYRRRVPGDDLRMPRMIDLHLMERMAAKAAKGQ